MTGRLVHLVDYLDDGDGVATIVRGFASLLALDHPSHVLALGAHRAVAAETSRPDAFTWRADDVAILYYHGPTRLDALLDRLPARRALYFNNVTPPWFFPADDPLYAQTWAGWRQLPWIAERVDAWLAPSAYSLGALARLGTTQKPAWVVPPLVESDGAAAGPEPTAAVRAGAEVNVLSVGRLAPNKGQHRVMRVFDHLHRLLPRSSLHLVGSPASAEYVRALHRLRDRLPSGHAMHMPGKVSDAALAAYYRTADLYLALSEHEGFCLPPVVAAAHGVAVVARAATALPETLGPAAVYVEHDDDATIARRCADVLADPDTRARRAAARTQLERYSRAAVRRAWVPVLRALGGAVP